MPDVLEYIVGFAMGVATMIILRRNIVKAEKAARKVAMHDFQVRQNIRTEAFNRGYSRAREDYENMTEIERFARTFEGHKVKMQVRGVQN